MSKDTIPELPEIYRTAIRVSDVHGRSGASFHSPEDQMNAGEEYARARGGIHDDVASMQNADLDKSGFTLTYQQRPGIMRHLEDAKAGKFQHLVFAYTDRSSRDIVDGNLLYREFAKYGVQVHYTDAGDPEDDYFETRRDMNLLFAAEYSRRLSKRAKRTVKTRTAKGLAHGMPPGWINVDKSKEVNDPTRYSVNEEVAAKILRLVELRLEIKGLYRIAKALNAEGVTTPKGVTWTEERVHVYLTEYYIRRMLGYSSTGTERPTNHQWRDDLNWLPNVYPPIIDEATADGLRHVERLLKKNLPAGWNRSDYSQTRGRSDDAGWMLTGKLKCATCGGGMFAAYTGADVDTKDPSKGKARSYRCDRGKVDAAHVGKVLYVDAAILEDAVARALRYAMKSAPKLPEPKKVVKRKDKDAETLKDLAAQLDRWKQLHIRGHIDIDEFEEQKREIEAKQKALTEEEKQSDEPNFYIAAMRSFSDFPSGATKEEEDRAWRRLVLSSIDHITVLDDLPPGAECLDRDVSPRELRLTVDAFRNQKRRTAAVKMLWEIEGVGYTIYAAMYRKPWGFRRLLFRVPIESI